MRAIYTTIAGVNNLLDYTPKVFGNPEIVRRVTKEAAAELAAMQARIAELEGALKEYANPQNWRFDTEGQRNIWWGDYAGPVQAKAALE